MSEHTHFIEKNVKYAANFTEGGLALPPSKKLIVVTCMDARVEPANQLGINLGDAHVIRNAGGVVKDALRSIIISQRLLGTREISVFHHTDCGMVTFSTPELRQVVKDAAPGDVAVAESVDQIDFHEFANVEDAVKSDVEWLKNNPLVLKDTVVTGWVYDVYTGKVSQVV